MGHLGFLGRGKILEKAGGGGGGGGGGGKRGGGGGGGGGGGRGEGYEPPINYGKTAINRCTSLT